MGKKMLMIVNPHSGKAQIKNQLLGILDTFCKVGYEVTVQVTPVSYTHLSLRRRRKLWHRKHWEWWKPEVW